MAFPLFHFVESFNLSAFKTLRPICAKICIQKTSARRFSISQKQIYKNVKLEKGNQSKQKHATFDGVVGRTWKTLIHVDSWMAVDTTKGECEPSRRSDFVREFGSCRMGEGEFDAVTGQYCQENTRVLKVGKFAQWAKFLRIGLPVSTKLPTYAARKLVSHW